MSALWVPAGQGGARSLARSRAWWATERVCARSRDHLIWSRRVSKIIISQRAEPCPRGRRSRSTHAHGRPDDRRRPPRFSWPTRAAGPSTMLALVRLAQWRWPEVAPDTSFPCALSCALARVCKGARVAAHRKAVPPLGRRSRVPPLANRSKAIEKTIAGPLGPLPGRLAGDGQRNGRAQSERGN